ncbi:fimbrial protein [Klebsiella michiganensis]|uniref:Type 1 fimbrial protein n=1 Tax=Klebsiella michiganensis TaxID=1134687 RepID=A0A6P1V2B2_9ENTR|nr:fimbrial protein [Klebsiella michiganensis]MEB8293577.1 type 1 fimbrial protein [Klebsiella michiganensis]MXJ84116.1 type 1 fimbrial protein [Klebsiella michiganensis]QHS47719.1 type 1 fimbrial protein [Klebsiella michiganensis]
MMKGTMSLLNKKAPTLLLCLAAIVLSHSASAADNQLNITGNIKASPCKVNVPTGGVNVDLGQSIMASSLSDAGSATDWKPIAIEVISCPATTSSATMTLNGTPDATESSMYSNAGTATGVQIELQNTAGAALGNASTMVQDINAATQSTTFNMQARAYSSKGKATPGTIVGVVQLTFVYQ